MITRPSASQVALEIRRELLEQIGPELTSDRSRVSLEMIENCLRNLAVRSEHEVAWMREECDAIEALASDVAEALGDDAVRDALKAYRDARADSLHAADVQADYDRASEALSCTAEALARSEHPELRVRLAEVLATRQAHELEIMGEFAFVGRG
jgi:hypothetical protein